MSKKNEFVGKNIEYLLKQKNISKSEFARMLYVDVKSVRRWTNNGTFPDKCILMICEKLNVSMDILINTDMTNDSGNWDTLRKNIESVNQIHEHRELFCNYLKALGISVDFNYSQLIDGTQIRKPLPDDVVFSWGTGKRLTMPYTIFEKFRKDIGISIFNKLEKY